MPNVDYRQFVDRFQSIERRLRNIELRPNPQLAVATGKTLTVNHSMTLTSADGYTLTIPATGTAVLLTAAQTLTNKTLTTPTIADFTNATHDHTNAAGGGQLALTTAVTGVLPPANGGTGVNNDTRTLTINTNSGTLAFSGAGYTLTIPKTGTVPVGTGTAGRIAEWVTDANTVQASTLAKTGAGVLTLAAAANYTLTVPATGTAALLGTSNTFTAAQTINGNLTVDTDTLFVDAANNRVGIGTTSPGAKLDVSSTNGGVNSGIRLIQAAENASAPNSYVPIDFTVPTSGLIGQFLATANNYVPSGFTSLSANALAVVSQATSGHLLLGAGGTNGYINFITGGYASANERMRITKEGNVGINTTSPSAQLHIDQSSASGAKPTLRLRQADLTEEFIRFDTTVGAGNPINTTALGAYYGRVRVWVEGVGAKWLALYD